MPKLEMREGTNLGKHRNGKWYWRGSTPGLGERTISTGQYEFRLAQKAGREIERHLLRESENFSPHTYEDVAKECFEVKQRRKGNRESTVVHAEHIYFKRLIPAFGSMKIGEFKDKHWIAQLPIWEKETDRTHFDHIQRYAKQIDLFAFKQGYKRFRCEFPIADPKSREGMVLTPQQFYTICHACVHWYENGKPVENSPKKGADLRNGLRLQLFHLIALAHGMRRSEVAQLEIARTKLETRSILLRPEDVKTGSQTGKGREFGISPPLFPLLERAVSEASSGWLFGNRAGTGPVDKNSINRSVKRIAKATGIPYKPHDLRHTFLTHKILVEKVNPMDVSIFGGVSLQTIQDRYLHATVEDTRHVVTGLPKPTAGASLADVVRTLESLYLVPVLEMRGVA